ncbi:hypothetical protein CBR_g31351 [Chara braunii]|uniref:GST C-terminal domain-containing protein n=1 Tax=Chara braunii TaxID=69332 RepID=A0A388LER2_CHABU|nr:hypothetical protein CBR_g31351 [Chara braunii]|eukprot:GBG80795.1 hypothetical protein CBR_g31351 [Chara braunii]
MGNCLAKKAKIVSEVKPCEAEHHHHHHHHHSRSLSSSNTNQNHSSQLDRQSYQHTSRSVPAPFSSPQAFDVEQDVQSSLSPPHTHGSVRIIGDPLCPYTAHLRIVVAIKGLIEDPVWVEVENRRYGGSTVRVDVFSEGKIKPPPTWFAGLLSLLSNNGTSPVRLPLIEHAGQVLASVEEAIDFLDALYPDPPLLPFDYLRDPVQSCGGGAAIAASAAAAPASNSANGLPGVRSASCVAPAGGVGGEPLDPPLPASSFNQTTAAAAAAAASISSSPSVLGFARKSLSAKEVRRWVAFAKNTLAPAMQLLVMDGSVATHRELLPKLHVAFARLESALTEHRGYGPFFFGPVFSLVDVYLAPFLLRVRHLCYFRGMDILPSHVNLMDYTKALDACPYVWPARLDVGTLIARISKQISSQVPQPAAIFIALQHESIRVHLDRAVRLVDEVLGADAAAADHHHPKGGPAAGAGGDKYHHQLQQAQQAGGGIGGRADGRRRSWDGRKSWESFRFDPGRFVRESKEDKRQRAQRLRLDKEVKLKELWKRYGMLWQLMQEHAEMEERILFPALERYQPGISQSAVDDHARDFPLMNGVKEEIKMAMAINTDSEDSKEALTLLRARLRKLQKLKAVHFEEEEMLVFPLLSCMKFEPGLQESLVAKFVEVMDASSSTLLPFLLSALSSQDMDQYTMVLQMCLERDPAVLAKMANCLKTAGSDYDHVWRIIQQRKPMFASFTEMCSAHFAGGSRRVTVFFVLAGSQCPWCLQFTGFLVLAGMVWVSPAQGLFISAFAYSLVRMDGETTGNPPCFFAQTQVVEEGVLEVVIDA